MLSVFVPAYNEEAALEGNIRKITAALKGTEFELIIVDDSSEDRTQEIGRRLADEDKRVKYLRFEGGPTRRENLAKSFREAGGEHIAFIDADLSAGPEYLAIMDGMLADWDIVIGSRHLPDSQTKRHLLRRLFTAAAGAFTRTYFNSRISDFQCGLKAFRREVIIGLSEEAGYDGTMRRGFAWDTEILLRAHKRGYRIAEIPVKWTEAGKSSVKPMRDWRMIPYVLALKKRL